MLSGRKKKKMHRLKGVLYLVLDGYQITNSSTLLVDAKQKGERSTSATYHNCIDNNHVVIIPKSCFTIILISCLLVIVMTIFWI